MNIVARLVSVPKQGGLNASEQLLTEDGDDSGFALGILTRAVDIPIAEDRRAKATNAAVKLHILLAHILGDPVGGEGLNQMSFFRRQRARLRVDRAGGSKDHLLSLVLHT